ncbi:hypothetical protein W01_07880 [Candidatus Nitrotoga sp. AM1P]|nr:hypothetical protein W01_07880 [Candidatus Nitrotoga sp. AM1P]
MLYDVFDWLDFGNAAINVSSGFVTNLEGGGGGQAPCWLVLPDKNPDGDLQYGSPNAGRLARVRIIPDTAKPDIANRLRDSPENFI